MNIQTLLRLISNKTSSFTAKENRFINMAGAAGAVPPEGGQPKQETPENLRIKELTRKYHETRDVTEKDSIAARIDLQNLIADGLNQSEFDLAMNSDELKFNELSQDEVQKLMLFCQLNPTTNINFDRIFLKVEREEISANQLNQTSIDILIRHYLKEKPALETLFSKLTKTAESTADTMAVIEKLDAQTNKQELLISMTEMMGKVNPETFHGLKNPQLETLIKTLGLAALKDKLSVDQSAKLLASNLENADKASLFSKIIATPPSDNLGTLSQESLIPLTLYIVEKQPDKIALLSPAAINKLDLATIKTLLQKFPASTDEVHKRVITSMTLAIKKELIAAPETKYETQSEIWESLSAEEKLTIGKPENKEEVRKGEEQATQGLKETFASKTTDEKLGAAGFETTGNEITFTVGESKSKRSFRKTATFMKGLEDKTMDSPAKVKLYCYNHLLGIITKDGSINSNKHNVENFREANTALTMEISRLEELILATNLYEKNPVDEQKVADKATKLLALRILGPTTDKETTYKIDGEGKATAIETDAGKIYDKMQKTWGTKEAPFGKEEFISANQGLTKDKALVLPFKGVKAQIAEEEKAAPVDAAQTGPAAGPTPAPITAGAEGPAPTPAPIAAGAKGPAPAPTDAGAKGPATATEKTAEPNNNPVENLDQSIRDLETAGVTFKEKPTALTVYQFEQLKSAATTLTSTLDAADNLYDLSTQVRDLGKKLQTLLEKTTIKNLEFNTDPKLSWDIAAKNGFDTEGLKTLPGGNLESYLATVVTKKLEKTPDKLNTFLSRTDTRYVELSRTAEADAETSEFLFQNLGDRVTKDYKINQSVHLLGETDIAQQWKSITGSREVDGVMTKPPFSLHGEQVAKGASEIITMGSNEVANFDDVFSYIKKTNNFASIDRTKIPEEFLESSSAFLEEFNRIQKRLTPEEEKKEVGKRIAMFKEIIVPALQLLESLTRLKYEQRYEAHKEKPEQLPEDQAKIVKGLEKLCNYQEGEGVSDWSKFIGWFGGAQDKMTMSDTNGQTYAIDEGTFRRHNSPEAALLMLTNRKGLYKLEGGKKILDEKAIIIEVNRLIQLAVLQNTLKAQVQAGASAQTMEALLKSPTFQANVASYQITSLDTISAKSIKAFQVGFILDQASTVDRQIEAGEKALTKRPQFKDLVDQMVKKEVPAKQIGEIQDKLLGMGGIVFKDGRFEGAALGARIELSDGFSFSFGLAGNRKGDIMPTIAADLQIYKGETVTAKVGSQVDLLGFTAGVGVTKKLESVPLNISLFAGSRFSWANVSPSTIPGVGLTLSWNTEQQAIDAQAEAESGSSFKDAFEAWKKIPNSDVEARAAALAKMPKLMAVIGPLQTQYGLEPKDIVHMIEGIQEKITEQTVDSLGNEIIRDIGVAISPATGFIPIPMIGIKIGEAKVFIPNRREIAKMKSALSDAIITQKLEEAVTKLEQNPTQQPEIFREQTPDLIYSRDGKLLVLAAKSETDLTGLATGNVERFNDKLLEAEVALRRTANGRTELALLNPQDKDIEIHIDPGLKELGVITNGNQVFLEGNLGDLIITRERFTLPYQDVKEGSTIRDVITIRQKSSVQGGRDRTWIEQNEKSYISKIRGYTDLRVERGVNAKSKLPGNVLSIPQFANVAATMDRATQIQVFGEEAVKALDGLQAGKAKFDTRLDSSEVAVMGQIIDARIAASQGLLKDEYEKQPNRFAEDGGTTGLDKLFGKFDATPAEKTEFRKGLEANGDNTEAVIALLRKQPGFEDMNDREANFAADYLINKWFTTVYTAELGKEGLSKANAALTRRIEARKTHIRDYVFKPAFEAAITRMNERAPGSIQFQGAEMAGRVIDQIYAPILAKLKDPAFDFRTIDVTQIPEGAVLLSGSRKYPEQGKMQKGAMAETVNYQALPKAKELIHDFGLLGVEGSAKEYSLANEETRQIGQVLLEVASPLPKENIEFLRCPLAKKFLESGNKNFQAAMSLIMGSENYKKLTEIIVDPSLIADAGRNPEHIAAFKAFREFINSIRKYEISGSKEPVKFVCPTGLTVEITMTTKIESGAYTKCANASFYVQEFGSIKVTSQGGEPIAAFNETTEVLDAGLAKVIGTVGAAVAVIRTEKTGGGKSGGVDETGDVDTSGGADETPTDTGGGTGANPSGDANKYE